MNTTNMKAAARTQAGGTRRDHSRQRRRLLLDMTVVVTFVAAWITHDQGATIHSLVSIAFTAAALVHARLRQPGWSRRRRLDHVTLVLVAAIAVSGFVDWIGSGEVSTGHGAIAIAGTLIVVAHVWQHRRSLRRLIGRARSRSRLPSPSVPSQVATTGTDAIAPGSPDREQVEPLDVARLDQPVTTTPVTLTAKRVNGDDVAPIACTLDVEQAQQRVDEWKRIVGGQPGARSAVTNRQRIDCGVRLAFDDTVDAPALVSLAQAEHDCCRFFSFAITIDGRGVGLDITAPDDAYPLIDALFGGAGTSTATCS